MRRQCNECIHYDVCSDCKVCDDFYPLYDDFSDDFIEKVVRDGYKEYQSAWNTYLREFNN